MLLKKSNAGIERSGVPVSFPVSFSLYLTFSRKEDKMM